MIEKMVSYGYPNGAANTGAGATTGGGAGGGGAIG